MNNSSRRFAAVAAISLVGLLAACGDDSKEAASTQPATTAAALQGHTYISQSATGITLVEGTSVHLSFTADSVSANAGCNTMSGGYTIENDVLIAGPFASTMMACDQALMDQDTAIAAMLEAKPTVALTGDQLVLSTSDITLTMTAETDLPLEGTTWTVTSVIANEAVSGVPGTSVATLTISNGEAQVNAGCNTGGGTATVAADTITFGPLAVTKKMCEPEAMDLEAAVLGVLNGEVTYVIEGSQLTLMQGDVGLELQGQA